MRILYLPNSYSQQRQREKKANIYPVRLASEAEWYRRQGHYITWSPKQCCISGYCVGNCSKCNFVYTGKYDKIITEPENLPFLSLPRPDRVFTRAKDYTSGNYKYLPGTHILSASGCWWGKCSFCVENGKPYEVRPVEDVISEILECKSLGFKEVFDDSATFPTGTWLDDFCIRIKHAGITFSCNMRIQKGIDFVQLNDAGFRMLLFGIESANQTTLDKIGKGVKVENIIPTIKKASECGIEAHIAVMFGYPWETDTEAIRTLNLVHYLLRKGYAKTAQASFYTPVNGRVNERHRRYVKRIYDIGYQPEFWFNKLKDIKNIDDIKYIWRGIKSWKEGL